MYFVRKSYGLLSQGLKDALCKQSKRSLEAKEVFKYVGAKEVFMLKDSTHGGSNGNKLDMGIFGLGRRVILLRLRDILGSLSKERHQNCFSVQQVKVRKALHRRGAIL